tara:strand:+ start:288271 stop:288483 length:213 start_codon:yes stop_codon:yes gene_type:complete
MSEVQTERTNGPIITAYIPVFKDKLAKLENRGLGSGEEAQRLRNTIAFVETKSSPIEAEKDERRFLVAAE